MTTAILASLTVVLLSVTVIEVVLNRRSERRWRLLAQYALLTNDQPVLDHATLELRKVRLMLNNKSLDSFEIPLTARSDKPANADSTPTKP